MSSDGKEFKKSKLKSSLIGSMIKGSSPPAGQKYSAKSSIRNVASPNLKTLKKGSKKTQNENDQVSSYVQQTSNAKKTMSMTDEVKLMARTNPIDFFLRWNKIDITSKILTENSIYDIFYYCWGVSYIVTDIPKKRWMHAIWNDKIDFFNGLILLYEYILKMLRAAKLKDNKNDLTKCIRLEKQMINLYKALFTTIPPIKIIRESAKILEPLIHSMCGDSKTNKTEATIIILSLFRDVKAHNFLLTSLTKVASDTKCSNAIEFLLQNYDEKNTSDKLSISVTGIIGRIYCSNFSSPLLDKVVEQIESSGFNLSQFLEEKKSNSKVNKESQWKEKFFAAQNELEELRSLKDQLSKLNDTVVFNDTEIEYSKKYGKALEEKMMTIISSLKDFDLTISDLNLMCENDELFRETEFLDKFKHKIKGLGEFALSISAAIQKKIIIEDEINKDDAKNNSELDKLTSTEKKLLEKAEDDLEKKEGDSSNDDKDLSAAPPPPPPPPPPGGLPGGPPPPPGFDSPEVKKEKERKKIIEKYEPFLGKETIDLALKKIEEDKIQNRIPFLNFCKSKPDTSKSNYFTEIPIGISTPENLEIYLTSFLKIETEKKDILPSASKKIETNSVLPTNYRNLISIVLKKMALSPDAILEIIINYDITKLNIDQIELLGNTNPKPEDFLKLEEANKNGNLNDPTEIFVFNVWSRSYARSLITFMEFRINSQERFQYIEQNITKVYNGILKISEINPLTKLFHSAFFLGNLTNLIKKKEPMFAYSLEGFENLLDTKANDKSNLLTFILNNYYDMENDLKDLQEFLNLLELASTVSISTLRIEVDNVSKIVENCENIINSNSKLEEYREFHKTSFDKISNYQQQFSNLTILVAKIRNVYCIDPKLETEKFILLYKNVAFKTMTNIMGKMKKLKSEQKIQAKLAVA